MTDRNDATKHPGAANRALLDELNWDDSLDFEAASRGFIASLESSIIADEQGRPVWDLNAYPFLAEETAPPTVNPSLWRQSRLLSFYHGLFKVTDGVY